jgi:outer membrane protein assembly factor BamB
MPSRRQLLATSGAALTGVLAGCTGEPTPDDPPTPDDGPAPNPDDHIFGADGSWSSFGCNAANNREVGDGDVPVDGVSERWRVPVGDFSRAEPAVADGRVFLRRGGEELVVYGADDGEERWRVPARSRPLVREDTVYVGGDDRLFAYRVSDGTERWRLELETNAPVGTPATHGGEWLLVPDGEFVHRVDAGRGRIEWSRRLFGRVRGPAAFYAGHLAVVATDAGEVYALGRDGTGHGRWELPAQPRAPPVTDRDGAFVACLDGQVYRLGLNETPRFDVDWSTEVGWTAGLAAGNRLYAAGTRGLVAVDQSGTEAWRHDTGDWRHTAPALGRDTLFVGGDALYAFDPTPSGGDGPALRFEQSFEGAVNAPVVDDGVVYVVTRTSESQRHLLALE